MAEEEINRRMVQEQFIKREYSISHLNVQQEFAFYDAVKDGDLQKVKEVMVPLRNEQLGHLSDNPLRNLKYHLIITVALITRFCIEGGMQIEDAYSLSDIYIQKLDRIQLEEEVEELHRKVILDFTTRMKELKGKQKFSIKTVRIMDYIYDHLHEKILLEDIAREEGMNRTYLCEMFRKETGMTVNNYILEKKIEAACSMLKYSEYSALEISGILSFSSHSYFISCFKKIMGKTPGQYREEQYRQIMEEEKLRTEEKDRTGQK